MELYVKKVTFGTSLSVFETTVSHGTCPGRKSIIFTDFPKGPGLKQVKNLYVCLTETMEGQGENQLRSSFYNNSDIFRSMWSLQPLALSSVLPAGCSLLHSPEGHSLCCNYYIDFFSFLCMFPSNFPW